MTATRTKTATTDLLPMLFIAAYLLAEFIPAAYTKVIDNNGAHWLYISGLNIVAVSYLFARRHIAVQPFRNAFTYALLAFCGIAFISLFAAYNKVEWLVCCSRLAITITAFANCALLLAGNRSLLRKTVLLLLASGALQAVRVVFDFANGGSVYNTVFDLGNKNILAASLMIKMGIAVFAASSFGRSARAMIWGGMAVIICAVYLLSARAAIYGMMMELLLCAAATALVRNRKAALAPLGIALAVFALVTIAGQLWSGIAGNTYKGKTVAQRIVSVKEEAGPIAGKVTRLELWHFALAYIEAHPLTGGGYGNWKINSIPYERGLINDMFLTKHAHNDFLEVAADTGIPGALVYLSLFGICGWYLVRIARAGAAHDEGGLLFALPFAGMAGYMADAMFNFPLERGSMQMLFALIAACNVTNYRHFFPAAPAVKQRAQAPRVLALTLLLISAGAAYISWQVFVSMQGQYLINSELNSYDPLAEHHSFDDISPYFGTIPNINENTIPIADIKAKFLVDDGRYDDAFEALAHDKDANPYLPFADYVRANLYLKKRLLDSAYVHYQLAHELRPQARIYYRAMQEVAAKRKDLPALEKNFREYITYRPVGSRYTDMAQWVMQVNNNLPLALKYLDEGHTAFPNDTEITFNRHYLTAYAANQAGNLAQSIAEGQAALKMHATYPVLINLGLAYYGLKDYAKAIDCFNTIITNIGPGNGEPDYLAGQCYLAAGKTAQACASFKAAQTHNYPVEAELKQLCK